MSELNYGSCLISPTLANLQKSIRVNKKKAISDFWKKIEKSGVPLFEEIEGDNNNYLITFIVREDKDVENIFVFNCFVLDDIKEGLLERLEDTNIYFKTYKITKGVRDTYLYSKNNPFEPKDPNENIIQHRDLIFNDPFNSNLEKLKVDGFDLPLNVFECPDAAPHPWYGKRLNIERGKIEEFSLYSEILKNSRKVMIYTPANYSKKHPPYHFLLLFDGIVFEEIAEVSSTLDNLFADDKIPPIVAVMIENFLSTNVAQRTIELPPNPKFLDYIIKELLPWARDNYNITLNPSDSVIAGASYGGIASSFIAFKHPEIFGNVLSMSGAYNWYPGQKQWLSMINDIKNIDKWWTEEEEKEEEWLVHQFARNKRLPLKFYVDVGILEVNKKEPIDLLTSNRHFRNVLNTKGYPVSYVEFLGGHDFVCWRGSIADGLIYLIGK
ncbi:MAG: alpha/beta hydrolase [Candidatus Hermodarchaeota archaeon]